MSKPHLFFKSQHEAKLSMKSIPKECNQKFRQWGPRRILNRSRRPDVQWRSRSALSRTLNSGVGQQGKYSKLIFRWRVGFLYRKYGKPSVILTETLKASLLQLPKFAFWAKTCQYPRLNIPKVISESPSKVRESLQDIETLVTTTMISFWDLNARWCR